MSDDTAGGWIDRLEGEGGQREALRVAGRSLDYCALARSARAGVAAIAEAGLLPGDIVAVLAPPSAVGVAWVHALLDQGIVLLPLNARLAEAEQQAILAATRPRQLVVGGDGAEALGRRLVAGSGVGLAVLAEDDTGVDPTPRLRSIEAPALATPADRARREQLRTLGVALLLMTSGTSGRPKGALLSRGNLLASAEASARLLGQSADDRWLLCMPLFHIGGLSILIRSALAGASVVLHPDFDARRVARALDEQGITRVSFVATMLERVLAERGRSPAPDSLALVLLGGGPAAADLIRRAIELGYPVAPTYGLTEAASQVATRPPERSRGSEAQGVADDVADGSADGVEDPAAGLVPLPGVALEIVDERGRPCAVGEEGEIRVRGPIVMAGYLDDPDATERVLGSGWLATGDIGRLAEDGTLRVLDRRADLIVSGGENVYPAEIESLLESHPGVAEAGVVGVPDARFGARPVALVVPRANTPVVTEALEAMCRSALAGYKQPREIVVVDALPRTATGKLRRRDLSALYASRAASTAPGSSPAGDGARGGPSSSF